MAQYYTPPQPHNGFPHNSPSCSNGGSCPSVVVPSSPYNAVPSLGAPYSPWPSSSWQQEPPALVIPSPQNSFEGTISPTPILPAVNPATFPGGESGVNSVSPITTQSELAPALNKLNCLGATPAANEPYKSTITFSVSQEVAAKLFIGVDGQGGMDTGDAYRFRSYQGPLSANAISSDDGSSIRVERKLVAPGDGANPYYVYTVSVYGDSASRSVENLWFKVDGQEVKVSTSPLSENSPPSLGVDGRDGRQDLIPPRQSTLDIVRGRRIPMLDPEADA